MWPFTSAACNMWTPNMCPWYHWALDFGRELVATLLTFNKGREFSSILASWMFLLAAVNLCYPTFLQSFCRYSFQVLRKVVRFAFPWLALRYVWVPVNCMLCCFVTCLGLPHYLRTEWLSFLSVVLGVLFLISSLYYTGFAINLHVKKFKRRCQTGNSQPVKDDTTNMRITRSGKVYSMGRRIATCK